MLSDQVMRRNFKHVYVNESHLVHYFFIAYLVLRFNDIILYNVLIQKHEKIIT